MFEAEKTVADNRSLDVNAKEVKYKENSLKLNIQYIFWKILLGISTNIKGQRKKI